MVNRSVHAFRREVVDDVGYFDKDYFMYVEEIDYAYRVKEKGWQIWLLPKWSITHYGGASGTSEFATLSEYKSLKVFYKKTLSQMANAFP